jgi:hypothetical protein
MTVAEIQLKYWLGELQTLQKEVADDNHLPLSISPALKDDLRKAVRRVQQFRHKVSRQKAPALGQILPS